MNRTLTASPPRSARAGSIVNVAVHALAAAAAFAAAISTWTLTAHLVSGRTAPTYDLADVLGPVVVLVAALVLFAVGADVALRAELGRPPLARRHLVAPALIITAGVAGLWPLFAWGFSAHAGCVLTAAALAFQCTVLAADLVRGYVRALQRLCDARA